jgi:hypothetical protein
MANTLAVNRNAKYVQGLSANIAGDSKQENCQVTIGRTSKVYSYCANWRFNLGEGVKFSKFPRSLNRQKRFSCSRKTFTNDSQFWILNKSLYYSITLTLRRHRCLLLKLRSVAHPRNPDHSFQRTSSVMSNCINGI